MDHNLSIQSSNGSTSISHLPNTGESIPLQMVNQEINNITMTTSENINMPKISNEINNEIKNSQTNYNELVNQLQKASVSGATGLPSRDIPIDPALLKTDIETKPNFIPQHNVSDDYINNLETQNSLLNQNSKEEKKIDTLEEFYNEFQIPLLLGILYFLFQLPIFKKYMKKLLPFIFASDGNLNLNGYLFNSILFASIFYILFKSVNKLSSII